MRDLIERLFFHARFRANLAESSNDKARIAELEAELSEQLRIAGMPFQKLYDRYKAYSGIPEGLRSQQVAFLHIGKTAGTSVSNLLHTAFSNTRIYHGEQHWFDEITPDELADYGLVLGHFSFNHISKMRRPLCLITFLRDPVERVLSSYYFLREAKPDPDENSANALSKRLSLREFLDCEQLEVTQYTVDHQCHALTGDWRSVRETDRGKLVSEALGNLRTFAFVGFVEDFDRSIDKLCRLLEFDPRLHDLDLHRNPTKARDGRSDVDPAVISRIVELNRADIKLYESARREFSLSA